MKIIHNKHKIEYKKIILMLIVSYVFLYITIGRIMSIFGVYVDSATDVALVYAVVGSYMAYCTASATDKHNMSKYGCIGTNYEKGDSSE